MTSVTVCFDGRVFVPEGPVDLPVGQRFRFVVKPEAETGAKPLTALLDELNRLPENPDWPADGATQHDHYLYAGARPPL
jgi:hypothetical protein